jgi:asparagine synthase (glutamine-hydrolysing)
MCGIVGVFHFKRPAAIDRETVERMRDVMTHRGPDGAGLWMSPDARVALGHRRLAIIDLSSAASQPMCNEDGSVWITFNGEIYNHMQLRRELLAAGHTFRTSHADTETIIHGYEQWGIDGLVQRLAGDYGFGLWDARRGQLHLVRDRIGVKPLYFALRHGALAFASEIKALLEHPDIQADIEPVALYHYLTFMTTPAPLTMFRGIYKLAPAHVLTVTMEGDPRLLRYWDATPARGDDVAAAERMDDASRTKYYVDGIRQRLETAVEQRMMSDVPFGVFLSGGIDSSTNVALMAELMDRPVDTFTVGFSDHHHLNELDYARLVAQRFGTNHREILINERDMVDYLGQLIHAQDEPIADWVCIPLYFVSKLARDSGTTVVQVGEGSDEQFCGYGSYMMYLRLFERYWMPYKRRVPRSLRRAAAFGARAAARLRPGLAAYLDIIDRAGRDREPFWTGAHVFWDVIKQRLVGTRGFKPSPELQQAALDGLVDPAYLVADSFNVVRSFLDPFDRAFPDCDQLARMTYSEFRLRLPELLLMRVDKIGMSATIEARVPFLDHGLVEFTMGIPQRFKVQNGQAKYLLKKAVEGLIPDEIINRKKMGFGAPMAQWLRGKFGVQVEAAFAESRLMREGYFDLDFVGRLCREHRSGRNDYSVYIWSLFNLVAWFDYWVDGRRAL